MAQIYHGVFTMENHDPSSPGDLAIRFPEMGNLTTHGLRQSDGSDLSQGFHHGKSRSLVTRTPDLTIPDFLKWEIS
jgi:hypothetical protein